MAERFNVGGVLLPRPFVIRRLGHFGINVDNSDRSLDFYTRLLGFRMSDPIDFGARIPVDERASYGSTSGYFLRHGTDHHSLVLFPRTVVDRLNPHYRTCPENTTNQITWQVGSLAEIVNGHDWFKNTDRKVLRAGRDVPGSNWHFYPPDPDGHVNELYYGIEQIGWSGRSKPLQVHQLRHERPPTLPFRSEYAEVNEAIANGTSLDSGNRGTDPAPETFDVDGVLLGRPFKVVKVGPIRLFVEDIDKAIAFYRDDLGLDVTQEVNYLGHRCVFFRANTEHHSLGVYPIALRAQLDLRQDTTLLSFGLQVATYTQLKAALQFLRSNGVQIKTLPSALFPGMDYQALAIDPDGHAIQLFYRMDQVGWDGQVRPDQAPIGPPDVWPDAVEPESDVYKGEVLLGPFN
ncbi:hypothetical protein GCM10007242_27610 [Pigmentiphaga litoralis]|nr:hypothetical protein GCM10007242_27610 [Pigmentiphaga litoralis]